MRKHPWALLILQLKGSEYLHALADTQLAHRTLPFHDIIAPYKVLPRLVRTTYRTTQLRHDYCWFLALSDSNRRTRDQKYYVILYHVYGYPSIIRRFYENYECIKCKIILLQYIFCRQIILLCEKKLIFQNLILYRSLWSSCK